MPDNLTMAREGSAFADPSLQIAWPRGGGRQVAAVPPERRTERVNVAVAKGYLVETDLPATTAGRTSRPGRALAATGLEARARVQAAMARSLRGDAGVRASAGVFAPPVVDLSEPPAPAPEAARDSLDGVKLAELQQRAEELGLPRSGTKADLAERIRAAGG